MPASRRARTGLTPDGDLEEACLLQVLGYQLVQASIVTNAIFKQKVELRPVEYTVLTLIAENPRASSTQLSRALAITLPHVTGSIDRLEADGLVRRGQGADDRRTRALHITSKGSDVVRKATNEIISAEKADIPISVGERAILLELLHKVAGARG